METLLESIAGAYEEVVGQSADGQWKEPSWAVYGITEGQALDLGRLYQQWAVFRWDDQGRRVLPCWSRETGQSCIMENFETG